MSNARHAIGDGDGGEARAFIERINSNARHTIGDGDGGEAIATPVFASCFVTSTYWLKGRKVMSRILEDS